MAPVEEELVDLCVMVMTGVGVKWEMTEQWNKILSNEILDRVKPAQRILLLPYTQGLQQAFYKQRDRFNATLNNPLLESDSIPIQVLETPRSFYFPG